MADTGDMTDTPDHPVPRTPAGASPGVRDDAHGHDGHDAHDSHAGHGTHEVMGEPLGPVDVAAWAAALLGAGIGALVLVALWVAISA
jgi:hypothetical protein